MRDITQTGQDIDHAPTPAGPIIEEFDELEAAGARARELGADYYPSAGVNKCYAVRRDVAARSPCLIEIDPRLSTFVLTEAFKRAGLKLEAQPHGKPPLLTPRGNLGAFNGRYIAESNAVAVDAIALERMRARGML
jgi:hypothetical protein